MTASVLIVGSKPEFMAQVQTDLEALGIASVGTTETDRASVAFDARDLKLVAIGGGVSNALRRRLKTEFHRQNPDVILVDVFAPVAARQIATALQGENPARRAAAFAVIEHGGPPLVQLDLRRECTLQLDLYALQNGTLASHRLVDRRAPMGRFEASIAPEYLLTDVTIVVATLDGEESYSARIEKS